MNHSTLLSIMTDMPTWADYGVKIISLIIILFIIKSLLGIVYIPENQTGVVIKKFVLFGENKNLPEGRIIATKGEAG